MLKEPALDDQEKFLSPDCSAWTRPVCECRSRISIPPDCVLPAWEEIYTTHLERKMSFEDAKAFGVMVRSTHETLGYRILEVPRAPQQERAQFILDRIAGE